MGSTEDLLSNMRFLYPGFKELSLRVLDAIKGVDRKFFLDDTLIPLIAADPRKWYEARVAYAKLSDSEQAGIPNEFRESLNELFDSYKAYSAEASGLAYTDTPLPIGDDQTCSQPSVVAFMADRLELSDGLAVLEGGTGCGYHAAVIAELIGHSGRLISVEINPRLVQQARKNLKAQFGDGIEQRVEIIEGDMMQIVDTLQEPVDRFYFTFAADSEKLDISKLVNRLRDGNGIILLPDIQKFLLLQKYESGVKVGQNKYEGYSFVPMQVKKS